MALVKKLAPGGLINQDAMSVAAASYTPTASIDEPKDDINIKNLGNFAVEKIYGTEGNLANDFAFDKGKLKTNAERKAKLFEIAKQNAEDYLQKAEAGKDQFNYLDTETAKEILSAVNLGVDKGWEKFITAAYKAKWEPENYLLTPTAETQFKTDQTLQDTVSKLTTLGLTPDKAKVLTDAGFTKVISQLPYFVTRNGTTTDLSQKFTDYLKSKNYTILDNGAGKKIIIDKYGNLVDGTSDGNQFNPFYGIGWKHTNEGLKLGPNFSNLKDYGNVGRKLIYEDPTQALGQIIGWSNENNGRYNKDMFGNRDYTQNLISTSNNGTQTHWTRVSNNQYKDKLGNIKIINLKGFGDEIVNREGFQIPERFLQYGESNKYNENTVYPIALAQQDALIHGKNVDSAKIRNIITSLNKIARTSPDQKHRVQALRTLAMLDEALQKHGQNIKLQTGGILKYANGNKLDDYLRKYSRPNVDLNTNQITSNQVSGQNNQPKQSKDIAGTLKNQDLGQNILTGVSLAGTAASFIPGVGAIGGGVSTVADAIHDYRDDNRFSGADWANLGMNVGFTILAGIGLGGLKGFKIAGKTAKEVSTFEKLISTTSKSAQVKDAAKVALNLGLKGTDDVAKNLSILEKGTDESLELAHKILNPKELKILTKGASQDIIAENKINSAAAKLKRVNQIAQDLPSSILEKSKKIVSIAGNPKIANYATKGLGTLQIGAGVQAGANMLNTVVDQGDWYNPASWSGDASLIKVNDLNNAVAGMSLGHMWRKNWQAGRAIEKYAPMGKTAPETKFKVKVGDKGKLKDESIPEFIFGDEKEFSFKEKIKNLSKFGEKKEALANDKKEAFNSSVNEKIASAYNKLHPETPINATDISDVKRIAGSNNGERQLIDFETLYKDRDKKRFKIAEKAIISNKSKPYSGIWYDNAKASIPENRIKYHPTQESFDIKKIPVIRTSKRNALLKDANKIKARRAAVQKNWDERLKSRKKPLEPIQLKLPFFQKKGGILKYETPAQTLELGTLNPKSLTYKPTKPGYLGWNPKGLTPGIFDEKGEYTEDFKNKRKLITQAWFDANKAQLQERINASGANFKLNTIDQLIAGTGDYHPGILHDLVLKSFPTTPESSNTATKIKNLTASTGNIDVKERDKTKVPIDWKGMMPDATDLLNLGMYAKTVGTNVRSGNEQRNAIASGMYTIPYLPKTYVRVDTPYTLIGEKRAGELASQAKNIANSTSDIDKALATKLTGVVQGNAVLDKAVLTDQQRVDQLRGIQLQSNVDIDQKNTNILAKNRALSADAFSKIHQINSNELLAQNAALNNLMLASAKNAPMRQYKKNQTALYNAITDKDYVAATDAYTKLNSTEGQAPLRANYDKAVKDFGLTKPWEDSSYYKKWSKQVNDAKKLVELKAKNIQDLMTAQYYQQAMLKKGGSLSKEDRIEIEREKKSLSRDEKILELTFKAIMHNNEMLQKSLIRVFK